MNLIENTRAIGKKLAKLFPIALTKNILYDRQTKRIFQTILTEGSNCIDVGCHTGEILDLIIKYAPNGKHIAFEPIPFLFENLKYKYTNSNWKIYNTCLSDQKAKVSFSLVKNNLAYSGIKQRSYKKKEEIKKITVNTNTLDEMVNGIKIDLIKIDVEGAELQVLKGAKSTIKKNKPFIIFEHGLGSAEYYNTTPNDVFQLLCTECGLKISTLANFLKNKPCLSKAEFKTQFDKSLNYYFIAHK